MLANVISRTVCLKNIKIRIYKTIILPVVLYGYETWSLALREEHRLRVYKNRVLRRIFGPKMDEIIGNDGLHNLYILLHVIRMIKLRRKR
jgi:hypothetical protein